MWCLQILIGTCILTYGIDIKSSNSASEDAFWLTVLGWRKARVVLDHAAGKYRAAGDSQTIHTYCRVFYWYCFFTAAIGVHVCSWSWGKQFTSWTIQAKDSHSSDNVRTDTNEPCHEKTCLQGFSSGKTNQSVQLQRAAGVLKFWI